MSVRAGGCQASSQVDFLVNFFLKLYVTLNLQWIAFYHFFSLFKKKPKKKKKKKKQTKKKKQKKKTKKKKTKQKKKKHNAVRRFSCFQIKQILFIANVYHSTLTFLPV